MNRIQAVLSCAIMGIVFIHAAPAQHRRDPLTDAEVDQLRDAAQEPEERFKLYVEFARARLTAIDKAKTDAKLKASDRAQHVHDRLRDFLDLYDELNDNVDTYADRKEDLRKALKPVIDADNEFQARLRALKDAAGASRDAAEEYEFLLNNALDTLDGSLKDHRQLLAEQDEMFKHKRSKP